MAPNPPLCRSDYYADAKVPADRGARIVRCNLLRGHPGDHDEMIDGESGVVTWPRRDEVVVDLTRLPAEQAFNLGALTAELLAEAEARGYQRAIDALREQAVELRNGVHFSDIPVASSLERAVDYLEASAQTAIRSGESTDDTEATP